MPRVDYKPKRTKLTDKQKKKIIADYVVTHNYCETARMNNVTETSCRRIINNSNNEELKKKVEQKNKENTKNILDYMDTIAEKQKEIINLSMDALVEKLKSPDMFTNVKDIATVYGIIYDKAIKSKELKLKQEELKYKNNASTDVLQKLDELLEEQKNAYMD